MSRLSAAIRDFWPDGRAGWALAALAGAGIGLRLLVVVSWWPVATTLADSFPYAAYAGSGPFDNPQHPAGYSLILAVLGAPTREVAFTVAVQHLAGIASALLLFAAVRRVSGSPWPGLLPAAAVLLGPDLIYLEHSIMSETWLVLASAGAVYCAVRAFDRPDPWYGWPLAAGLLAAAGAMVRTQGIFLVAVIVVVLLLSRPRPWTHWRAPLAAGAAAAVALLGFATVNAVVADRFGIGPSPGWYLYGRVAQFADCNTFEEPAGSRFLCDRRPAEDRPGANYYLFDPSAPAPRRLDFGERDDLLAEWSRKAIVAQTRAYLETVWDDLRSYYVPSSRPPREDAGGGLDPQLDFTRPFNEADRYFVTVQPEIERGMERFYDDFSVSKHPTGLRLLRAWQHVTRFGAVALAIGTLLVGLGLLIGSRRARLGVALFGLGGLSLLIAPALAGNYVGRYTVAMAGLVAAGAGIAIASLVAAERARRRSEPA